MCVKEKGVYGQERGMFEGCEREGCVNERGECMNKCVHKRVGIFKLLGLANTRVHFRI